MTQKNANDAVNNFKCALCEYTTKRKFDLKRHQNAKHNNNNENQCIKIYEENVNPTEESENCALICKKCNKIYKTKKYLLEHELKCNGLDDLTC